MAFSPVPKESKSQINKAGQILVQGIIDIDKGNQIREELLPALELVDKWRACHAYPINTFQSNLRGKLRGYNGNPIAAQRLKRMPTIINKLVRYPNMKLTTMQDIGGVRAILNSVEDVYNLADEFRNSRRLAHELIDQKDYIQNPRSEDGYRSLHLIYKYNNKHAQDYNGLRIEIQIRTKLQHIWATAVETMGTFLGQALKSRQGDSGWLDFFAIVSSVFAHKESCAPVPRFSNLSYEETLQAIVNAEAEIQALEKMRGLSIAAESIDTQKRWAYHLIILDSLNHAVQIKSYDRDSFESAVKDYNELEKDAAKNKIEPVLVSAGPFGDLRKAYPNFFLDIRDYANEINQLITATK